MSETSLILERVREDLFAAIEEDTLSLPTLPEVALEIRAAASDPDVDIAVLAAIIENDTSIAARLIRVANSAAVRGREPTVDVKSAIGRIGMSYTASLVTSLAMQQIFLSTTESLNKRMRSIWVHCADVAAVCHTLAAQHKHLKPDQATLAGVSHQIGALPILSYSANRGFLRDNPALLDKILICLSPMVGTKVLASWGFSPELVAVPEAHLQFGREVAEADYADLVTVANLQAYHGTEHPLGAVDWQTVSAFKRLGMATTPGDDDEAYLQQIEQMQSVLRG